MEDNLFDISHQGKFTFNEDVANVFDDMLNRSIPFYIDNLKLNAKILSKYIKDGDKIYDIGSSTLNFLLYFEQNFNIKAKLIGIDSSKPMIIKAKSKIKAYNSNINLIFGDIENITIEKSQAIISNYTLQFIAKDKRSKVIDKIFNSLNKNGIFLISEKVISNNQKLNTSLIEIYHNYKQENGYSTTQIEKKKEALENILVPLSLDENISMLKNAGFKEVEVLFKWANFSTFLAIK
jgi:tRNA (cmo5U34)-methyltransferase